MNLQKIDLPFNIDPGGTTPEIAADEHDLQVSFFLLNSNNRGEVRFKLVLQFTFGYPNDEAISGHRYYKLGLRPFEFVAIKHSEVLQRIIESNRVHPRHKDEQFNAVSYTHLFLKPNKGIFKEVERLTNHVPHEILMIGDSFTSDSKGGQQMGWKYLKVNRYAPITKDYEISNLQEIKQRIIESWNNNLS